MLKEIEKEILNLRDKERAKVLSRFFKTGKGQYGEGDKFLGITVPKQRLIAKKYKDLSLNDAEKLMLNKIHEFRLTAILILVHKFRVGNETVKKGIVDFYLRNTGKINNWDLVDLRADKILGAYLIDKDKSILYKLARSKNVWERRIAVISTFNFIKNNQFEDILNISEILLNDKHDLIQKSVGWMLREIGKRNLHVEESFLKKHYKKMSRTMLRYAIERFDGDKKKFYMQK